MNNTQDSTGEVLGAVTCSAFALARHNDVTVNAMLRANACHTEIIGVMAKEKAQLLARIMELEAIAPRRITLPDGRVMVWRCPDHLLQNSVIYKP